MNSINRLLERQMKQLKLSLSEPPSKDTWVEFIRIVDRVYTQNEENRYLQERSLAISSKEMREALQREKDMSTQLAQAAKLTSIGTLASGVAHELNNPLAGIKGYAEIMLLANKLRPEEKTMIERIVVLVDRMSSSVKHLLKLARKPADTAIGAISLREIVQDTLELFSSQLVFENIEVEVNLPDENLKVKGEANRLISVIQNLVNNAREEFLRNGNEKNKKSKILIDIDHEQSLNGLICLRVKDNAGGIAPEIVDRIFDPFFTTKEVGMGTGLGLSLSRRLIEDLGGQLMAKSSDGESTFYVYLKRFVEDSLVSSISESPTPPVFNQFLAAKKSLLLVDDEIDMLTILGHHLNPFFDVEKTTSSLKAAELLNQRKFDYLVTDLKMPGISGDALIELARQLHQNIGIVMVSGHAAAAQDSIAKINDLGVVLVNKPLPDRETLISMILSTTTPNETEFATRKLN
jgi:signal transduction histidine kinase/ActR/RegA family two-component response regulator